MNMGVMSLVSNICKLEFWLKLKVGVFLPRQGKTLGIEKGEAPPATHKLPTWGNRWREKSFPDKF